MKFAAALLIVAWVLPLTPIRRLVPSESVIAFAAAGTLVATFYVFGLLD